MITFLIILVLMTAFFGTSGYLLMEGDQIAKLYSGYQAKRLEAAKKREERKRLASDRTAQLQEQRNKALAAQAAEEAEEAERERIRKLQKIEALAMEQQEMLDWERQFHEETGTPFPPELEARAAVQTHAHRMESLEFIDTDTYEDRILALQSAYQRADIDYNRFVVEVENARKIHGVSGALLPVVTTKKGQKYIVDNVRKFFAQEHAEAGRVPVYKGLPVRTDLAGTFTVYDEGVPILRGKNGKIEVVEDMPPPGPERYIRR